MVHAISEEAAAFYRRHGFAPSPDDPMVLTVTSADVERAVRVR